MLLTVNASSGMANDEVVVVNLMLETLTVDIGDTLPAGAANCPSPRKKTPESPGNVCVADEAWGVEEA